MTLTDIIALAKNGYKPGDIKEIIEMAKTIPEPEPFNPPKKEQKPEPNEETKTEPTDDAKTPPVDYAAELEKLKAENEKIKSDLAKAQEMNRNASSPEIKTESDDEIIKDIVLSFMR